MDTGFLQKIGLNKTQAIAYKHLVETGSLTPPELATLSGEGRTNAYKVLDQLAEQGLCEKKEVAKKLRYYPTNPTNLELFVESQRKEILQVEQELKSKLPMLLNYFYTFNEQPGIKFYQGKESLVKMYEDQLRTKQEVYFITNLSEERYFGDTLYKYMQKRAKLGIKAYGLSISTDEIRNYAAQNDKKLNRVMTWFPKESYTAPVEIDVYGNKVAFISFGEEAMGTIIESPQIAEAMRQVFGLMRKGAYALLPSENDNHNNN